MLYKTLYKNKRDERSILASAQRIAREEGRKEAFKEAEKQIIKVKAETRKEAEYLLNKTQESTIKNLINQLQLSDQEIASLTNTNIELVRKVRSALEKNKEDSMLYKTLYKNKRDERSILASAQRIAREEGERKGFAKANKEAEKRIIKFREEAFKEVEKQIIKAKEEIRKEVEKQIIKVKEEIRKEAEKQIIKVKEEIRKEVEYLLKKTNESTIKNLINQLQLSDQEIASLTNTNIELVRKVRLALEE